jgi:hypothetical protein
MLFPIVSNQNFELFISLCISLNTIAMAMTYFGMSRSYAQTIDTVNYTFAGVFFLEAVMKLSALKFENYFHDIW